MHLVALIGIRNMLLKEEQYYDERTCSLSDYSVIVSNLPAVTGTGKMVRNLFKDEFDKDLQVKQLIYIFEDEKIEGRYKTGLCYLRQDHCDNEYRTR